jgi:hypothetical protein
VKATLWQRIKCRLGYHSPSLLWMGACPCQVRRFGATWFQDAMRDGWQRGVAEVQERRRAAGL